MGQRISDETVDFFVAEHNVGVLQLSDCANIEKKPCSDKYYRQAFRSIEGTSIHSAHGKHSATYRQI